MGIEKELADGNLEFSLTNRDFRRLSKAQHPKAVVLACSDSRVAPEIVLGARLGELFVVRNAGNVAGEEAIASIEYAARHLGVKDVIIMPHTNCGAVTAAQKLFFNRGRGGNKSEGGGLLGSMTGRIYKNISKNRENANDLAGAVMDNALAEAGKIMDCGAMRAGGVRLHIALYDIADGRIGFIDKRHGPML